MAKQFKLNCPHCFTKRVGFTGQHGYVFTEPHHYGVRHVCTLSAQCNHCNRLVVLEIPASHPTSKTEEVLAAYEAGNAKISRMYPESVEVGAPASVPDDIASVFEEGISCLQNGSYRMAAVSGRAAIEMAANTLVTGGDLKDKILKLYNQAKITKEMKEWCDLVRLNGNDAVHELTSVVTKAEAVDTLELANVFLEYMFTLPAKVAAAKNKHKIPAVPTHNLPHTP